MSSNHPSYYFRDPLVWAHYTPYILLANETIAYTIDLNVAGDSFLNIYIEKLNEELFAKTPDFKSQETKNVWQDNMLNIMWIKVTNEIRKHGWCILKFYEDDSWKVFSPRYFEKWLTEEDEDGRKVRIGVAMNYTDDLGNNYREECIFSAENLCFLIKWQDASANNARFADADLNQAIMTRAYNIRQINDQLVYSGTKPNYYHFVYGDNMTNDGRTSLKDEIKNVNRSVGIGMREDLLKEIRMIPNGEVEKILAALEKQIQMFAGATRLPLSYFIGERASQGLSNAGETVDEQRIEKKKMMIFRRIFPYIKEVMLFVYGITVEVDLEEKENEQRVEENNSE